MRHALTPSTHLEDLLYRLAFYFSEQPATEDEEQALQGFTETRNLRVGLYAVRDGVITPLAAANMNNPNSAVFSSFEHHPESFRLDSDARPSLVVRCLRERRTLIVEDCVRAEEEGNFFFFNDNQRGYLASMVAYYLDEVCGPDGTMLRAALVIDTDATRFFRESDRDSLEFCLREFGSRLKLELLLQVVMTGKGASDEQEDR